MRADRNLNIHSELARLLDDTQRRPWQVRGSWIYDADSMPVLDLTVLGDTRSEEDQQEVGELVCLLVNKGPEALDQLLMISDVTSAEFRVLLDDQALVLGTPGDVTEAFRRVRSHIWAALGQDVNHNPSIDWDYLTRIISGWQASQAQLSEAQGEARQARDQAGRAEERGKRILEIAMTHLGAVLLDAPALEFGVEPPPPLNLAQLDVAGWALKARMYAAITGEVYADPNAVQPDLQSHPVREMDWSGLERLAVERQAKHDADLRRIYAACMGEEAGYTPEVDLLVEEIERLRASAQKSADVGAGVFNMALEAARRATGRDVDLLSGPLSPEDTAAIREAAEKDPAIREPLEALRDAVAPPTATTARKARRP